LPQLNRAIGIDERQTGPNAVMPRRGAGVAVTSGPEPGCGFIDMSKQADSGIIFAGNPA
jgi:hypothetical protein